MTGPKFKLTLYVTPDNSGKALVHLYQALCELPYDAYQLEMIDVLQDPQKAKGAGVIGTPTLVYHATDGDKAINTLSDLTLIRRTLGISA
ncbi:MAG: circadian clock KaiB family protein [Cyanobacteriota bacterium]